MITDEHRPEDEHHHDDAIEGTAPSSSQPRYRGSTSDPLFGYLLALAVSIGLTPLLPDNADLRYSLAWGALAAVGVLAWLLGTMVRIEQEKPENIFWGLLFGVMISSPFLLFFNDILATAATLLFPNLQVGTVFAFLVFVMPLAETLFFRGLMQRNLDFWIVGLLGSVWSIVLFFPVMWEHVLAFPAPSIFIAVALFTLNLNFSYVNERNGLAAAWICQIVAGLILFFVPLISATTV